LYKTLAEDYLKVEEGYKGITLLLKALKIEKDFYGGINDA
jgi:hypothetical protein